MGVYYCTSVLYGLILTQDEYDKIKEVVDEKWITEVINRNKDTLRVQNYILTHPHCCYCLNYLNPRMLKKHVKRGCIYYDEVDDYSFLTDNMQKQDVQLQLNNYLSLIGGGRKAELWMIEVMNSTYTDYTTLTKTLPFKKRPWWNKLC